MAIVRAEQSPIFQQGGNHFRGLTSPSRGASELVTWQLEIEPETEGVGHSLDHEEVFIILEGALVVSVNGAENELKAGDAISVPAHSQLAVSNRSDKAARSIVCVPVGIQAVMADGTVVGTPPWAR